MKSVDGSQDSENQTNSNIFHEESKVAMRGAEVLLHLMRNESLRDTCYTILQSFLHRGRMNISEESPEGQASPSQQEFSRAAINNVSSVLVTVACRQDVEEPIRLLAIKTLHFMAQTQDIEPAWNSFKALADDILGDPDSDIVLAYLNLLGDTAAKYDITEVLPKLFRVLASNRELYWQSLEALEVMGRRETVARAVIKTFGTHLSSINLGPWSARRDFAKLLGTLVKGGDFSDGISQLLAMGTKDEDEDVRKASLEALADISVQPKNLQSATVINAINAAELGKISIMSSWEERMSWATLLSALCIHSTTGFDRGRQKLLDLVVEDEDEDVRNEAYKGLHDLHVSPKSKSPQDNSKPVAGALEESFMAALRHSSHQHRFRAVRNLHFDSLSGEATFNLFPTLQKLASPLVSIALNDKSEDVRHAAVDLIRSLINYQLPASYPEGPKTSNHHDSHPNSNTYADTISAILIEIASNIPSFNEKEKILALSLIESIPQGASNTVVSSFARKVSQLLEDNHGLVRGTALEMLRILQKKGFEKELVQSNVSNVLTIVLEDSRDHIRVTALNILTDLCSDRASPAEIVASQLQLFNLLHNTHLRSAAVDLISLLAKDESVRHSVADWIISVITTDSEPQLEGIMALLSTLVIEKRLGDKPQGCDILLFLAPALVLNPSMAKLRVRVTALLWCNYRKFAQQGLSREQKILPASLMDSFVAALFGHHVAQHELKAWKTLKGIIDPHVSPVTQGRALPVADGGIVQDLVAHDQHVDSSAMS
ncbi:armadillo-type protein [Coprinopsis sp. MPI-PUGE-AT-0042]|nr:armadillo-type protein [Coprinopsis sp. MPI-PUGE-AT-0042]